MAKVYVIKLLKTEYLSHQNHPHSYFFSYFVLMPDLRHTYLLDYGDFRYPIPPKVTAQQAMERYLMSANRP